MVSHEYMRSKLHEWRDGQWNSDTIDAMPIAQLHEVYRTVQKEELKAWYIRNAIPVPADL